MRSILLHVSDDASMEARLQTALDIARRFDGHITCFQPVALDLVVSGDIYGTMIAELLPIVRENADTLRERIGARLAREDVAWEWRQEEGPVRPLLMRAEALADLVVLGERDPTDRGKGPSSLADYMAVHGRSPLLVVPESSRSLDLAGSAVIGWNGSIEGARALRGAVPLLRRASSVAVINVTEQVDDPAAALPSLDAAEYLSRHEIRCEIVEIARGERTVAGALADAAAARKAAYLVMGAYGHSRAVQTVFGGVTRDLFCTPPLPLFTAH
jgi:nucleotide-binding universal stress UspA family protein